MLVLTLCVFACYAEIVQVNDMKEVYDAFSRADSKTWIIFDVDMVLIQSSDPAFQMANMKRYGSIFKRILQEVPTDKKMMFLSLMTISSEPVLIDERTPHYIEEMIQKGVPVMALTANLTGPFATIQNMEQWRVDSLRKLGIDFSKSAPCHMSLVFDDLPSYRGYYSTYLDGIFFANGTSVSKGEAFLSFLKKSGSFPNRVIFIDDREENLKSLEAAIQTLDTPVTYQGLHYLGAQNYPSKSITEEEFESKLQKLASEVKELN